MAKLQKEAIKRIIERDLPGRELAKPQNVVESDATEHPTRIRRVPAEAQTRSVDTLLNKYTGRRSARDASPDHYNGPAAASEEERDEDEQVGAIVATEPTKTREALDRSSRTKAVVISSDGDIIGEQG